eukprot:GGOE01011097.1.p5 GENE.GGOE01011097.1~~GGOE01011097.1.p5  ORF type:complete len:116 (+),score=2.64 GGOE01011097.1:1026-1373(+)
MGHQASIGCTEVMMRASSHASKKRWAGVEGNIELADRKSCIKVNGLWYTDRAAQRCQSCSNMYDRLLGMGTTRQRGTIIRAQAGAKGQQCIELCISLPMRACLCIYVQAGVAVCV